MIKRYIEGKDNIAVLTSFDSNERVILCPREIKLLSNNKDKSLECVTELLIKMLEKELNNIAYSYKDIYTKELAVKEYKFRIESIKRNGFSLVDDTPGIYDYSSSSFYLEEEYERGEINND